MSDYNNVASLLDNIDSNDPFIISEQNNITVRIEPLGHLHGYYCVMFGYKFIHISNLVRYELQRFICAHELGHALIHPEVNAFYELFPENRYERHANEFAINLLLRGAHEEYPDFDLYQLAKVAGIPKLYLEASFDRIFVL